MVEKNNFELTISLNTDSINEDETLTVNAVFKNLSSNKLKIIYSGSSDISSIIKFYYAKIGIQPDLTNISNAVQNTLKKEEIISKEYIISNLEKGDYQIFALVIFYNNDKIIELQSDTLNFIVL